jgi:solute carrier family 35 protein E1
LCFEENKMVRLTTCLVAALAVGSNAATPPKPMSMRKSSEAPLLVARAGSLAPAPAPATKKQGWLQAASIGGIDATLLSYFAFWYLGNYYYTLSNKRALVAGGGKNGYPMTISTLQLGVGVLYALFAWLAPDMRAAPQITMDDVIKMIPVGFCAAAAHSFSVFAQSAGAVSFAMIVKAAEPAFAAIIGVFLYGKQVSQASGCA